MATKKKQEWMDLLVTQLINMASHPDADVELKTIIQQKELAPHINVLSEDESVQVKDGYDARYRTIVALDICTIEQKTYIEDVVDDIKELCETINLADNVYQVNFVNAERVAIEDGADGGSVYSWTRVNLEVIWSKNFTAHTISNDPAYGLTEPIATAHYKVYSLLYSGSYGSQPLGTNVYPAHNCATVDIPAGSGSILVGALSDTLNKDYIEDGDVINNHTIQLVIDIPTAYSGGQANLNKNMRLCDDVVNKIRSNLDLDDQGYWLVNKETGSCGVIQIVGDLPESATIGSRIIVTVDAFIKYTQES